MSALYHAIAWSWGGDGQGGPSSTGYLITSGPIPALSAVCALLLWAWRSRCEEAHCWRPARRHDHEGKAVCPKHYRLGLPQPASEAIETIRALNDPQAAARLARAGAGTRHPWDGGVALSWLYRVLRKSKPSQRKEPHDA